MWPCFCWCSRPAKPTVPDSDDLPRNLFPAGALWVPASSCLWAEKDRCLCAAHGCPYTDNEKVVLLIKNVVRFFQSDAKKMTLKITHSQFFYNCPESY